MSFCRSALITTLAIHTAALGVRAGAPIAHFYVSPDGADGNAGAIDAPFATFDRARLAVRALIAQGADEDIVVLFRGGVYRIETPVRFDVSDSAPIGRSVRYAAYPGERPVISGARVIAGWAPQGDGSWTTVVPGVASGAWDFREVFVNGRRRQRARHPNEGFLLAAGPNPAPGSDPRYTFAIEPGDLPGGTDLAGAELNMLHEWTTSRVRVDHVDPMAMTLTTAEPIGATGVISSIFQTTDHPRYAVENHAALLDAPGEWYLDRTSGVLTYRPVAGEFIESTTIEAPIASALLVARGDFETAAPVRGLHFEDLAFEHCAWGLPTGGYASYQSGYYEPRVSGVDYELPAAIRFELAEDCQVLRTRVAHCGGWGVMLGAWCRRCSLVGSIVTDIAGNGVIVGEDRYRRVDGVFWVNDHWEQVALLNQVISCLVQDCGVVMQDAAAVWVGLTDGTVIANNHLRRMPHIGITAGGFWDERESPCRETNIVNNRIEDVTQLLSDGGGVYTIGRQPTSRITNNLISGIPPPPGLARNVGIFLDEGATGFHVEDNGVYDISSSAFKFHWAGENTLVGNTMRLNSTNVDAYYFQSTNPADIPRVDDIVILPGQAPAGCEGPVCGEASDAGLLAQFASSIYADRDSDGIPDIEDACIERRPGDVSGDGVVNGSDVADFVAVLMGASTSGDAYCASDVNQDGVVSPADLPAFVVLLVGSP
ncbi:MAG TPA: right-handed parallel beta-helix repeat-containing protein [Phycisphaerae bacterium]|nr:right-handed parallel beta-helix repeat-containing protein [Phycisphaerae bacterium]HRW52504.1 right-handed parallel beta-helix repeat-containing protein [Phycisphaerae bacterium]